MADTEHRYTGEKADILWDEALCIHASECVRATKETFNPDAKPWIEPDKLEADEAAAIVARCPSGALSIDRKDGGSEPAPPRENIVSVTRNGPLYASGNLKILMPDGSTIEDMHRVALCRCGLSDNKPFCDNSHIDSDFADEGPVPSACERDAEATGGVLELRFAPNGPIMAKGPMKVRAASGRDAMVDTRGFFCRCGQSGERPFCDGTHNDAGFEAAGGAGD